MEGTSDLPDRSRNITNKQGRSRGDSVEPTGASSSSASSDAVTGGATHHNDGDHCGKICLISLSSLPRERNER